ncbi:MAG TPA: hypothetical protein VFH29_02485 [Anaerolineales bacterium]|nr:hypothetical protein [Anaerolineales bacterium]
MPVIYRFLGTHEVLIYILLSIGGLFGLRWLWRSWNEWRHAAYSLEREFALRRIGQSVASLAVILFVFVAEFIVASFVYPSLPAAIFVPTSTPDLFATPTGTISAELATAIALTPRPTLEVNAGEGCVANRISLSEPRSGQEVRGSVEIRGTVNIPDLGFYKYEVASAGSDIWATIAAGRAQVTDGPLGQWDTSGLAPGDYQLRLVVSDNQGQSLPACIITVRVSPQT